MVRKILGKKHYLMLNFVIFFDMTTSSILFLYFSAKITSMILSKYNIFMPNIVVILLILILSFLVFVLSFFNLSKISILSYLGK